MKRRLAGSTRVNRVAATACTALTVLGLGCFARADSNEKIVGTAPTATMSCEYITPRSITLRLSGHF